MTDNLKSKPLDEKRILKIPSERDITIKKEYLPESTECKKHNWDFSQSSIFKRCSICNRIEVLGI